VPAHLHAYGYAPWFAALLIPATVLPTPLLVASWHAALAMASAAALWPAVRTRTLVGALLAALVAPFLFHAVWIGHYEPLLVALLVWALPTRWGAVAIGIAASIKITPLVLTVRFAGRGEWGKVIVAGALAAALWAPALLMGFDGWRFGIGLTLSPLGYEPLLWLLLALTAVALAWRLAPSPLGWSAASVAWLAVMPRMLLYDAGALAVGLADLSTDRRRVRSKCREHSTRSASVASRAAS
jgi:hypothetical protein